VTAKLLIRITALLVAIFAGVLIYTQVSLQKPTAIILASNQSDTLDGLNGVDPIAPALRELGYQVFSLDLPCHYEGMETNGLECWAERITAGEISLLSDFCSDVSALIDRTGSRRVQMVGVSRGGFIAYQCGAQDDRVTEIAQLAPVTDLSRLREFEGAELPTENFDLSQYVDRLRGKQVLIRIGSRDHRVGTDSAVTLGESIGAEIDLLDVDGHRAPDPNNVMAYWLLDKWN
jgi:pimeloyl-ACP methyl ester carboxylesterase